VHEDRGLALADFGDGIVQAGGQVECIALPIAGQILSAGLDRAVGVDASRTADADERRQFKLVFLGGLDQPFQHADQTVYCLLAARLLIAVPPQLELTDFGFRQIVGIFEIQTNNAGADISAADVNRENRVVGFEHPGRRQVRGAD